jgi:hypothetical protein
MTIDDACPDDPVFRKKAKDLAMYMAKNIPWERHDECIRGIANDAGELTDKIKDAPVSMIFNEELRLGLREDAKKYRYKIKRRVEA